MASLHLTALASHAVGSLSRLTTRARAAPPLHGFVPGRCTSPAHVNIRFMNEARFKVKERRCPIFASNTNLPDESKDTKTSEAARGPPFLTILAGFVVFFGICWMLRSIVVCLFGLIVHRPPLK